MGWFDFVLLAVSKVLGGLFWGLGLGLAITGLVKVWLLEDSNPTGYQMPRAVARVGLGLVMNCVGGLMYFVVPAQSYIVSWAWPVMGIVSLISLLMGPLTVILSIFLAVMEARSRTVSRPVSTPAPLGSATSARPST